MPIGIQDKDKGKNRRQLPVLLFPQEFLQGPKAHRDSEMASVQIR